jgi:hypothetical protein
VTEYVTKVKIVRIDRPDPWLDSNTVRLNGMQLDSQELMETFNDKNDITI